MSKNNGSGGVGFCGLLTTVFIVLKLVGVISWSWFWVLSPTIFGIVIGVILVIIIWFSSFRGGL